MRNLMYCTAMFTMAMFALPATAQSIDTKKTEDSYRYTGVQIEAETEEPTNLTKSTTSPNNSAIPRPKIQVVFLLDATGSMSHLIDAAKEKIWSIASSLTQTLPKPILEFGMVFYRDLGDDFVTKVVPLGTPMDDLYEVLMSMRADGGGDGPESVNQALHEGVTLMKWDNLPNTYRTIFLVGDYPPHMDYPNDVKYPETCKNAVKQGIIINTILMGNEHTAHRIWMDIARRAKGEFIQTNMNANNISINSPYDVQISDLQYELDITRIYYGVSKEVTEVKLQQSIAINKGGASSSARRAEFNVSSSGKGAYYGTNELINDVQTGHNLSSIKKADLPENLQKMSPAELESYVNEIAKKREELEAQIIELNAQRAAYISKEMEPLSISEVESSFDNVIFNTVKEQASHKFIDIQGKSKK